MIITQLFLKALAESTPVGLSWTSLGLVNNVNTSTSGAGTASASVSVQATIPAGSVVMAAICMQSSASPTFGNVTDSQGNVWTLVSNSNATGLYYSKLNTSLVAGNNITLTVTNSVGSFTPVHASAWKYSIPAGKTVNFTTPTLVSNSTVADPITLSGLTSREYLFFRVESAGNVQSGFPITATSGFTLDKYSNNGGLGLYREHINEVGTGKTSDPTGVNGGASNGRAIFTAFYLT